MCVKCTGLAADFSVQVQKLLHTYPFKMYDNPVSIMQGDDEGIFSWFTLNFLSGERRAGR